jgi:hypothetical protein
MDLITPLLEHVQSRKNVDGCSRQCEELRIETVVIRSTLYHLECGHYCADHLDHRCCVCSSKDTR